MSALRNAIDLLVNLGLYDVVLPFLLVFTLMYAFLEKTRVLGVETVDDKVYPKKNLNAMVAFVVALFVILSGELVRMINEVLANVVLLIVLIFLFLLVYGSFVHTDEKPFVFSKENFGWLYYFLGGLSFLAILLIFLNAFHTGNGKTWLQVLLESMMNAATSDFWSVVILLIVLIGGIALIVRSPQPAQKNE